MAKVPDHPKIYHITHVKNLPQIVKAGVLWSDAKRIELGLDCDIVGMSHIKQRRLEEIEVGCHAGTKVGEYVPFYFCPRSIMLYILHKGNHPDIIYTEGQQPIVHLQADLEAVVDWAVRQERRWAFTTGNAGARYVNFFNNLNALDQLNWTAIGADKWSDAIVKEGKQAEFLIHESLSWELVEKIGVYDDQQAARAQRAIACANHQPIVSIKRDWYY